MSDKLGPFELNKVHCVDMLEALPLLPDGGVDLVLTDPPYDQKTHDGARLSESIGFEPLGPVDDMVSALLFVSMKWVVVFCSLEMLGEYKTAARDCWIRAGVWDRIVNMPQLSGDRPAQAAEGIAFMHRPGRKTWNGGGAAALWRWQVERGYKVHPTQKPLGLISNILRLFSNPTDIILDPFMGSGTTGVAAVQLGRRFLGFEINPEYCELANKRIEAARKGITVKELEYGQGTLFNE